MTVRPPVPRPAPIHRPRCRAVLVAALLTLGAGGVVLSSAPVAAGVARVAQDPAGTVTSTTVAVPETPQADDGEPALNNADEVAQENRRIWLVVGGLVVVALALLILTIRYWRLTKPVAAGDGEEAQDDAVEEPEEPVEPEAPAEEALGSEGVRRRGQRSRRSVAGADHATADSAWEPRGTGEHERIQSAPTSKRARISSDQRRAAYEAARR